MGAMSLACGAYFYGNRFFWQNSTVYGIFGENETDCMVFVTL